MLNLINSFFFRIKKFSSTLMAGTQHWVKGIYGILAGIIVVIVSYLCANSNIFGLLNWEVGFIDPSTIFAESLILLYNYVWFYLVLVLFIVVVLLTRVVYLFSWKSSFFKYDLFFDFMSFFFKYFITLRHNFLARSKLFKSLIRLNDIKARNIKLNLWYSNNNKRYYDWAWRRSQKEAEKFLKISDASEYKRLEVVWCGLPTIILLSLATPSIAFIYTIDPAIDPIYTIKIIGRQWYWNYNFEGYISVTDRKSELYQYTEIYRKFHAYLDFANTPYNSLYRPVEVYKRWEEFFFHLHTYKSVIKVSFNFDSVMKIEGDLIQGSHRLLEVDNRLVIPVGVPIRFVVTSLDVIHSWAVPSLAIKVDAVPGRLNQFIVEVNKPGIYFGQCSELCGPLHGFMPVVIAAVPASEFEKWLISVGQIED